MKPYDTPDAALERADRAGPSLLGMASLIYSFGRWSFDGDLHEFSIELSEAEAEEWIPVPALAIVSITEPGQPASLLPGWGAVLRLGFQDFDTQPLRPNDMYMAQVVRKVPDDAVLFSVQQASLLAEFLREHRGKHILAHCAGGISRSSGVVEAILAAFPEYELLKRRLSHPNLRVKAMTLRALGVVPIGAEGPTRKPNDRAILEP